MHVITGKWKNTVPLRPQAYVCGQCGHRVSSDRGWPTESGLGDAIYICSHCSYPTLFASSGSQIPGELPAQDVEHLPELVQALYGETRKCFREGAYTAATLVLRKLIAHIAVDKSAPEGSSFLTYVEYLSDQHYVPPNGKDWVDLIRKKGNQANHEIVLMDRDETRLLLDFVQGLLTFIYAFPGRLAASTAPGPNP